MNIATLSIEPETAAWLAEFAAMPPRENQTIQDLRDAYKADLVRSSAPAHPGVAWKPLSIQGEAGRIDARLYVPLNADHGGPLLLYVHGGGFAVGDLESHDGLARLIAAASGLKVMTLDYRRAPEAPYPAARDDVLAAFRWVVANAAQLDIDPARIVVGGESAGAAHAVASALALRGESVAPRAVWIISPALDATTSGETYRTFATGAGRTAAEFAYLWSLYVPDSTMHTDPGVSPGFADPVGLPPLYIYTSEFDPARSDGEAFAEKARAAGVPVTLRRRNGLVHQHPEITGVSAASRQAVEDAAKELAADLLAAPTETPDIILTPDDLAFQPFNIPGFSGDTRAAFPNMDTTRAPFIALLKMAPGATLKRHFHPRAMEAVYVMEGTLMNDGQSLPAGSFLVHGPGVWHGPHVAPEGGCTLMFIQYPGVGPDDSVFVD
ncbi:carboxylesterase family protein (plasmid) [Rhizobium sp. WL3]|uniref:alpha/beta hydrolase fold domain-containing protein n=1 Tax=Rhizobium sp. WL3 TaxID=2603277 RepID=UPI0011C1FF5F|nr:alpha/beta hydrolase fold domain-containing protein [Rhizobium sp. WL3]QEE43475.1 carboxylesterase family protein [Rhizobium sp. WL3]